MDEIWLSTVTLIVGALFLAALRRAPHGPALAAAGIGKGVAYEARPRVRAGGLAAHSLARIAGWEVRDE